MQAPTTETHPIDLGWYPHERDTWTHRYARLRQDQEFYIYDASTGDEQPHTMLAGTLVKIVMVSRLGDVGITDDLSKEYGYQLRVPLAELYDYQQEQRGASPPPS